MWRKKTDKRIVAGGLLALALVIGYQSWRDFQPKPRQRVEFTFSPYVLATVPQEMENVPKSVAKLAVRAGDISAAGEVTFTPSTLPPVLAQQEVMPFFTLDILPSAYAPVFEKMTAAAEAWKDKGNLINDIYIDYQGASPDFQKLYTFVSSLREHVQREYYVVLQLKRPPELASTYDRNMLGNMLKSVAFFVYDLKDVQKPGDSVAQTIERLDKEGLPFAIRVQEKPDNDMMVKAMPEPKQFFNGFLIDAPDAPVTPSLEEKKP